MSFSIGKLRIGRAAPKDPEGRMTLVEHLAELRSRLIKAVLAILLGMIVAFVFRERLFELLSDPLRAAIEPLQAQGKLENSSLNYASPASPLMLYLKISLVAGLVASSPIWLYQIWAFIMPGLHKHERRWAMMFVGIAAPLFIAGVLLGYMVIPKGLEVLLGFVPEDDLFSTLLTIDDFVSFVLRVVVVFGIAFLIPIFVILLDLVGVLSAERIGKWRAPIIFFIFVFAAVATPTIDPITMLLLAIRCACCSSRPRWWPGSSRRVGSAG